MKNYTSNLMFFSPFNSWDRWVLEDQVLECSEMNKLKMKRLHEEAVNRYKLSKMFVELNNIDISRFNVK